MPASVETSSCTRLGRSLSSTLFQRVAQRRMVAADAEDAEAAQQIEIARARGIEQILTRAAAELDVIADGPQHADHLLVEMAAVHVIAVGLPLGEHRGDALGRHALNRDVVGHARPVIAAADDSGAAHGAAANASSTIRSLRPQPIVRHRRPMRHSIRQRIVKRQTLTSRARQPICGMVTYFAG